MTDVSHDGSNADGSQLRERPSAKPLNLHNSEDAKQKVLDLNNQEEKDGKGVESRRTYGRTPDGTGTWMRAMYGYTGTSGRWTESSSDMLVLTLPI
jgi:hypothetical protein